MATLIDTGDVTPPQQTVLGEAADADGFTTIMLGLLWSTGGVLNHEEHGGSGCGRLEGAKDFLESSATQAQMVPPVVGMIADPI